MARQSSTSHAPANARAANLARAFSNLERTANFVRANLGISRVTAGIASGADDRWQLPAHAALLEYRHRPGMEDLANRETRVEGSESGTDNTSGQNGKTASVAAARRSRSDGNAWHRRSSEIRDLTPAIDALSRVERAVQAGRAARMISSAGARAEGPGLKRSRNFVEWTHRAVDFVRKMVAANEKWSPKSGAGVSRLAREGVLASARFASSIRGVIPPTSVSPRELAEPSGNAHGPSSSGMQARITINSSPTVVINPAAAGGSLQREVIGALRAHREELFDQLKRESARRERAQF